MIRVVFVDAGSGDFLGESSSAPEQIPESFEAYTQVRLSGADWEVVRAEPMTRAAAVEMGQIKLVLRRLKIEHVAPERIHYSLPSINEAIPPIAAGTSKLDKNVLELGEDDFRQVELVSRAHETAVRTGLAAIERIVKEARTAAGAFERMHVRTEVPQPLADRRIGLSELRSRLQATDYDGLTYRGVAGLVEGGFGLQTRGGLRLYGLEQGGVVAAAGLLPGHLEGPTDQDATALAAFMGEHNLVLVDWCRTELVDAGGVRSYLAAR